ncbi:hypothetical protein SAMN04487905_105287 [Actinopolyspora xinjiangensis]|uniref:Uncharacterized protein n=1 Tax=Actinopolyspora xinjiangensis TaxID=405564 RepID=A0A1H0TUD4_9ACTN|nr:hypothetical protein SAMN04487905_105287 [Actinopolyspora xinjiangensis]
MCTEQALVRHQRAEILLATAGPGALEVDDVRMFTVGEQDVAAGEVLCTTPRAQCVSAAGAVSLRAAPSWVAAACAGLLPFGRVRSRRRCSGSSARRLARQAVRSGGYLPDLVVASCGEGRAPSFGWRPARTAVRPAHRGRGRRARVVRGVSGRARAGVLAVAAVPPSVGVDLQCRAFGEEDHAACAGTEGERRSESEVEGRFGAAACAVDVVFKPFSGAGCADPEIAGRLAPGPRPISQL